MNEIGTQCHDGCLRPKQAGVSLVELMVAMALSLFLVAGVATMYFSSFQSYRVQKQSAQLAQRERLAATFVGSVVQSAGYYTNPVSYTRSSAFPEDATFTSRGQFLLGADDSYTDAAGDTQASDSLQMRMRLGVNGRVLTCLGHNNGTSGERLFLNKLALDKVGRQLECTVKYKDASGNLESDTQPLLDDVASLEFTYAVDTDGDGSADRYLDATSVTNWKAVRAVVMTLGFLTHDAATASVDANSLPVMFRATFPVRMNPR